MCRYNQEAGEMEIGIMSSPRRDDHERSTPGDDWFNCRRNLQQQIIYRRRNLICQRQLPSERNSCGKEGMWRETADQEGKSAGDFKRQLLRRKEVGKENMHVKKERWYLRPDCGLGLAEWGLRDLLVLKNTLDQLILRSSAFTVFKFVLTQSCVRSLLITGYCLHCAHCWSWFQYVFG